LDLFIRSHKSIFIRKASPAKKGGIMFTKSPKKYFFTFVVFLFFGASLLLSSGQDILTNLAQHQNYRSKRISSFDRTGGNRDRLTIEPAETAVLAEIKGPASIHHIWVTISAEPFYGRKIILRMYWDGEESPSVEVPIGDFFGVGHGLNRNFSSLPINCSSEGRARNCYWSMPFKKSARITVTNEGTRRVGAFYYYIDYRELPELPADTPSFHAQYRQEMPCQPGKNYLILDASGKGHYVGCNLSILQRAMGWWGEGDDMIYVDGEEEPSLYGTGSEDYFSDAWGMREDENLFYGCPLQEPDFKTGSKATVYRFHIPDPIPFNNSIRVTIEHGHANNRSDYFSSVAYWYQSEPHKPFPTLLSMKERLPFALESTGNFTLPEWEEVEGKEIPTFEDKKSGMKFKAENLSLQLTSYYDQRGDRYPGLITEMAREGTKAILSFPVEIGEHYNLELYFLKGPSMGNLKVSEIKGGEQDTEFEAEVFKGFSPERKIEKLTLKNVLLHSGDNEVILQVTGKAKESGGMDLAFVGMTSSPSSRRFIKEWNLIGPFDAPDMSYLQQCFPPEEEIRLRKKYQGKVNKKISWQKVQAEESGFIPLTQLLKPNERTIAYGLVYVFSSKNREALMLVGSDDGVRIWLNEKLVHSNPAYRGAYPDQDKVPVELKQGWNKLLVKVLQGGGGWGFYLRFVDPEEKLRWSTEFKK
jgi:hypothetical protein